MLLKVFIFLRARRTAKETGLSNGPGCCPPGAFSPQIFRSPRIRFWATGTSLSVFWTRASTSRSKWPSTCCPNLRWESPHLPTPPSRTPGCPPQLQPSLSFLAHSFHFINFIYSPDTPMANQSREKPPSPCTQQYFRVSFNPFSKIPLERLLPLTEKQVLSLTSWRSLGKISWQSNYDNLIELSFNSLNTDFERPVQIEVTVQEALTGRRQNTSASIPLHKNKYKMELVNTSPYYKPGLKFTTYVSFSQRSCLFLFTIFCN